MTARWLAAGAALFLFGLTPPALAEDFNPVLAAAMVGTRTPAMAMLVMRDGKVSGEAVRGVRRNDRSAPARVDDVWHIGSDGKAMTATLIARLVDRGVLSWNAPLSEMLPDLADSMRPEYRPVTLLQLLSHHAGLPHDISDTRFFETFYTDARPLPRQRRAYVARALREAPVAPPGTTFNYSNTGFIIAAAIAERATGSSYETLMRREVFQPLGMTSVGFGLTHGNEPFGHHDGKPLVESPDGKPVFTPPDGKDGNPLFMAPAGNMYLTIGDWARFCLDQMKGAKGEGHLLKPQSYRLMQTAQPNGESGLGWGVQATMAGRKGPALVHAGSDGTWYALVVLFPQTGSGVLAVANAGEGMGGDKADMAALKAVLPSLSPADASAQK